MISKKYLGLLVITCTIIIGNPGVIDVDATVFDDLFKYRQCLFEDQFWNAFCPSNPGNAQPGQLCLANDKNCVIK